MYSKLAAVIVPMSASHMDYRTKPIDSIVIHYTATVVTNGSGVVEYWQETNNYTSANYIIDVYGRITGVIPEEMRPYTTGSYGLGSRDIDDHAITVECSCDDPVDLTVGHDTIYALTSLMADIGLRHKIKWKFTGNENGNIHAHRWYQNTPCPGDYLYYRLPKIEAMANAKMKGGDNMEERIAKLEEKISVLESRCITYDSRLDDIDLFISNHIRPSFNSLDDIPIWAKPEIKWLIDKGYIKGNLLGLNLSVDMVRLLVILVRTIKSEV